MAWPNPRPQRTPSASPPSPLSGQPLGALKVLLIVATCAAAACVTGGRARTGSLDGLVVDAHFIPMPGATVTLEAESGQVLQVVATTHGGEYAFRTLPAASYRLTVQLPGFASRPPLVVPVGVEETFKVIVLKPDATLAPLEPAALVDAQVAVVRELMKLARKAPPYYALAVVDGKDYGTPSTMLLEAVTDLSQIPVKQWPGYDAHQLLVFSDRDAIQLAVMACPDAQLSSVLFLSGSVTEYGRTQIFRFELALQGPNWVVTDLVKTGTVTDGWRDTRHA